jgi:hypothetical protein
MPSFRRTYYEVDESCFLFIKRPPVTAGRRQPEEAVRQWCLHELIRAYGFQASDISVETPVKVGSKNYRIDILVSRSKKPWAVIETKERGRRDIRKDMGQAISYADAQEIRAEFAVVTNGEAWHVKRRLDEAWVAVPDLPCRIDIEGDDRLFQVLNAWEKITTLIYKLDAEMMAEEARCFLSALQGFFHGPNLFTLPITDNVRMATDNLLRSLWAGDSDPRYRAEKMGAAVRLFEHYREAKGYPYFIDPPQAGSRFEDSLRFLSGWLLGLVQGSANLLTCDGLVLQLDAALTNYGLSLRSGDKYPRIPTVVLQVLRDLIDSLLALSVGAKLPTAVDKMSFGDIKQLCAKSWRGFEAEEKQHYLYADEKRGSGR